MAWIAVIAMIVIACRAACATCMRHIHMGNMARCGTKISLLWRAQPRTVTAQAPAVRTASAVHSVS
jgi:hypothetical protein